MKAELSEIAYQIAEIKITTNAILAKSPPRLAFPSGVDDGAMESVTVTGVVLRQSYPVEVVAGIAAACAGGSHRERLIDALRLLEEAEEMAAPDPWKNQYSDMPPIDCSGEERRLAAKQIIELATEAGRIRRKDVLKHAYEWAKLAGAEDAQGEAYGKWAASAMAECAMWEAWDRHIQKHPEQLTPEDSRVWEAKWKKRWPKKGTSHAAFTRRFEMESKSGQSIYFRDRNAAFAVLAGYEHRMFTPLLEYLTTKRQNEPMQARDTKQFVSPTDRETERTRNQKLGDVSCVVNLPTGNGAQGRDDC
jgi:hypothetical protein